MRIIPAEFREQFFTQESAGAWRIDERVRRMVTFGRLNLIELQRYGLYSELDIVFCRNVLIYFGPETRRLVIDAFYTTLRNGGYFVIGRAESLIAVATPFRMLHLQRDLIYTKMNGDW